MRSTSRLIMCLLLPGCVLAGTQEVSADKKPDSFFVIPYNIQSISEVMTDAECKKTLSHKVEYNIKDNKTIFKPTNPRIKTSNYTRLTTTYISHSQRLFTGVNQVEKSMPDKTVKTFTVQYAFLLNTDTKSIRGSFYIPGKCKANFIGLQENLNHWHHP